MGTSSQIKLLMLLCSAAMVAAVAYFGFLGEKKTEITETQSQSLDADDDNTSDNVGFTDEEELGKIVSETQTQQVDTQGGFVPPTPENPTGLDPVQALRQEMELERLRQMLEADINDEMARRTARKAAIDSSIGASTFVFADQQGVGTDTTQPVAQQRDPLARIDPSLVLPNASLFDAPVNSRQESGAQVAQRGPATRGQAIDDPIGYSSHSRTAVRSPYEIKKGTVIPGTLVTEINSDIPGNVVGMVRHDVFDTVTGQHRLIPSGSRLFGLYDPSVDYAQKRINVIWTHLIFPNGDTLILEDQQATDVNGQAGFADKRKGNFLANLGGNLLYSILNAAETGVQTRVQTAIAGQPAETDNGLSDTIAGLGSKFGVGGGSNTSASGSFNEKHSALAPTLQIRSGYRFNILVSKDIILEPN